jgi:hypothetical protein
MLRHADGTRIEVSQHPLRAGNFASRMVHLENKPYGRLSCKVNEKVRLNNERRVFGVKPYSVDGNPSDGAAREPARNMPQDI